VRGWPGEPRPGRNASHPSIVVGHHHGVREISSRPSGSGASPRATYARHVEGLTPARAAAAALPSLSTSATVQRTAASGKPPNDRHRSLHAPATLVAMTYYDPVRQIPVTRPQPPRQGLSGLAWVLIATALVVGCVGGVVATSLARNAANNAGGGSTTSPGANAAGDVNVDPTTRPPDANTISDNGILIVGKDIKPGTYSTTVPADSLCYWSRLSATDGSIDSIIANDLAQPGSKVTVTIKPTDKAFKTDGCGTWHKVG
jgi:hypothetical protein